jgi:glycosyltransferase involved in cell wall biosynthesis
MAAVTVLMPVYNAEKFLSLAIESILQQTFTDFEFLIIDDGSTDQSVAIVTSYPNPRIRLYQNEQNLGISATLNKGIELARTELIARMDADDVSYPGRLQSQVDYLKANPSCAMVSSLVRVISEDGKLVRQDRFKSEHFYYNLTFICWLYHPTVMYRKQAVQEVGMYTATYAEDYELFWQLSRNFKFYNLPEVLLDYRITGQSLHQVLKKQEYQQAQQEQILRNLRHFAGEKYTLPKSFIECLQHNFAPLEKELKVRAITACVKELDFITSCILAKENVNLQPQDVQKAATYKKRYIVSHFLRKLPWYKSAYLLLRTFTPKELLRFFRTALHERQEAKRAALGGNPTQETSPPEVLTYAHSGNQSAVV